MRYLFRSVHCAFFFSVVRGFPTTSLNRSAKPLVLKLLKQTIRGELWHGSGALRANLYDEWSQDLLSTAQSTYTFEELQLAYCDEEAIEQCLEEFMDSDYGKTMFGRHDLPASVGYVLHLSQEEDSF
jgi:hypothetical protein